MSLRLVWNLQTFFLGLLSARFTPPFFLSARITPSCLLYTRITGMYDLSQLRHWLGLPSLLSGPVTVFALLIEQAGRFAGMSLSL